ncbi:MAG: outer membrane beta-barrel protein [Bacteroidia bacterium]|nr:outer membrane beta-barrel protein [Bacteroidia bacterium]
MKTLKVLFFSLFIMGYANTYAQKTETTTTTTTTTATESTDPAKSETVKWHPNALPKWPAGKKTPGLDSGQYADQSWFQDRRAMKWTAGIIGGMTLFHGDADKLQPGWVVGPYVKYSVSQTFGIRAEYNFGKLRGERDFQSPTLFKDNFKFRSYYKEYNIQMMITLGNISFIRPLRRTQMYMFLGLGQGNFNSRATFTDQRLFLGDYYLTSYFGTGAPNPNLGKDVEERYQGRHFIVPVGLGLKHSFGRRIDVGLEYRYTYLRSDDIDVYNTHIFQNRNFDAYSNIRLSVGFKFGNKNAQHYDWLSPVESVYDKITVIDNKVDSLTSDKDGDRVSDYWDRDNNTPDSTKVYGDGTAVDSDGDGVPDKLDKERFTPNGVPVDADGVGIDSDGDGVPDALDRELNSAPGALVDRNGVEIKSCCNCDGVVFPSIPALKNCKIGAQQESLLYQIADKMKQCPDKKLVITGPAGKSSKYNGASNTRCIDAIAKYLNEKYGISRDRIVIEYVGGKPGEIELKLR